MRRAGAIAAGLVQCGAALLFASGTRAQDPTEHRASALRSVAAQWEALVEAEDARAPDAASLRVLMAGTRADVPELRLIAVRALGRLERPELVDSIAGALRDSDARVRAVAANALAQAAPADARVRSLLLAAIRADNEEPVVVAAVAESLGRLQHADAAAAREVLDALRSHLNDTEETRLGVLRGMYFMARQPRARAAFNDDVRSALAGQVLRRTGGPVNDERARVVAVATMVAAGAPDIEVLDSIHFTDPSPWVRREAVAGAALHAAAARDTGAMYRVVPPEELRASGLSRRVLITAMRDSVAAVRYEALRGWLRVPNYGCAPYIDAVTWPHPSVRQLGYDVLGGDGCATQPGASDVLRRAVDSRVADGAAPAAADAASVALRNEAMREAGRALVALAGRDAAAARERLDRFTNHPDPFVRMSAARATAVLEDEALLRAFAQDEHANARTIAVQALGGLVGTDATDVYLAALGSDESELLMASAVALEGTSDPVAPVQLLDALDRVSAARSETSRDGRIALLDRIRELGSTTLAGRLRPYLSDFDPAVAAHVAETLSAWTGERNVPAPRPLPREPLPTFEEAAALETARFSIELENGDVVVIRLLPFDAPANAFRFARLAQAGYFDGLTFHRVVPNFVVQGGSPGANEYGGAPQFSRDELGLSNGNWRGAVGLSTRGRDTGDAQFYINLIDNVRLDHAYTVFAMVESGMDVVDLVQEGAVISRVLTTVENLGGGKS